MVGDLKKTNEKDSYDKLYWKLIISFVILAVVLVLFVAYYFFYFEKSCATEACFKKSFDKCDRTSFIKEDNQSAWLYQIIGNLGRSKCLVKVTLLQLKQGSIENQELQDKSMVCQVLMDNALNPESDLSSCNGILKEKMQEIIIQKMHNYLLKNIQDIKEQFNTI